MAVAPADVDRLYDEVLAPRLASLEELRLSLKGMIRRGAALVLVPFALFWAGTLFDFVFPEGTAILAAVVAVCLVCAGILVAAFKYLIPGVTAYLNYQQRFKHEVVSEVFRIVCPTATYAPDHGISQSLFDAPALFNTRGSFKSDDHVSGRIGDTPFEAAEVQREYSTGGKNSKTQIVFKGLFFHIDFNKQVRGTTIVEPESAPGYRLGDRSHLSRVSLEHPEFSRRFTVYSDDEVEARYILTPVMMEQLLSLCDRTGHPVYMAFKGNRAYLGVHIGRALFEPGISSTTSKESIHEMARLFALAEAIVHELDLNTRIWTKEVDDSILRREEEPPADPVFAAVKAQAREGSLTAEQLWAAATAGVGDEPADDAGPVAQPARTSVEVHRSPAGATIVYPGLLTLVLLLNLWLGTLLIALSAMRTLLGDMAEVTSLTALATARGALPAIPALDEVTARAPVVFLAASAIIGGLIGLSWMFRVRKVTIAPDAVEIHRGFRPWPRRYPRPPFEKVIVLQQRTIYIGRSTGLNLINPSASPMLKEDEARWVASEMRRAFKETAIRASTLLLACLVTTAAVA